MRTEHVNDPIREYALTEWDYVETQSDNNPLAVSENAFFGELRQKRQSAVFGVQHL